jgi:hypothetical protein
MELSVASWIRVSNNSTNAQRSSGVSIPTAHLAGKLELFWRRSRQFRRPPWPPSSTVLLRTARGHPKSLLTTPDPPRLPC